MTALSEDWRRVLSARSMRDKIGVARDCELCPVHDLPIIAELVREGILKWLDRATLPLMAVRSDGTRIVGIDADVYLLTPKGVALCDANGIARR